VWNDFVHSFADSVGDVISSNADFIRRAAIVTGVWRVWALISDLWFLSFFAPLYLLITGRLSLKGLRRWFNVDQER